MKELPAEVRQHLASKIDDLDFDGKAKAADKFYDKQGKLREATASASINHVDSQQQQPQRQPSQQQKTMSFTSAFPTEDVTEVNAVRFPQGQRQQFTVSNGSSICGSSSSFNRNSNSNDNSYSRGRSSTRSFGTSNDNANPPNKKVCRFHTKFGEDAERCKGSWCTFKGKVAARKGQASR